MRLISLALITTVAMLALAGPTFAGTRTNTLIATDGPGYTITMNYRFVCDPHVLIMHGVLKVT